MMFQLAGGPAQIVRIEENANGQQVATPVEPDDIQPAAPAGRVVGRIGTPKPTKAQPIPAATQQVESAKPRSFRAELQARRKVVQREVKLLRRFETELQEIDQMLAALPTTARKS